MSLDAAMIAAARERAESLYSKGKFREALATYEKLEEYGRKDPRIYMRMGDIAGKLGAKDSVISFYKKGAESFLSLGFTLKAVAVCKMILALDPGQKDVQASLAKLHGGQGPAARPEVPRTPLFSGLTEGEFLEVLKKVRSVESVPGAYIFREGDPGDSSSQKARSRSSAARRTHRRSLSRGSRRALSSASSVSSSAPGGRWT